MSGVVDPAVPYGFQEQGRRFVLSSPTAMPQASGSSDSAPPPADGAPVWTRPPRLAELGLPPAQPPSFDDFACRTAMALECGAAPRTGSLPAVISGCFNGLFFDVRGGAPFLCSFQASSEVPDAGPIAASFFS